MMSGTRTAPVTTKLALGERPSVFGNAGMTAALLHRITQRCHILGPGNESARFNASTVAATRTKKEANPVLVQAWPPQHIVKAGQFSMQTPGQF